METDIEKLSSQLQESRSSIQLDGDGSEVPRELLLKNYKNTNYLFRYSLAMWANGLREFLELIKTLRDLYPNLIKGGFNIQKFNLIMALLVERVEVSIRLAEVSLKQVERDIYKDEISVVDLESSASMADLLPESNTFVEQLKNLLETEPSDLDNVSP